MNGSLRDDGRNHDNVSPCAYAHGGDTSASAKHRQKLEAMFARQEHVPPAEDTAAGPSTAHAISGHVRPRLTARRPAGRSPSEYSLRLERLRMAREDEIEVETNKFLQHHQLPDDMDILLKVLQHPGEGILRDAIGQIAALIMQGRRSGHVLLADRLATLAARPLEPRTRCCVDGLRSQLAGAVAN